MARAGTRTRRTSGADQARKRVIAAAVETLKAEGYAGASARAIAQRGGFSQALVFYHFGSMAELLAAALADTSAQRMAAYQRAMNEVATVPELVAVASKVFRQDLQHGHVRVLAEVITAASSEPGLSDQIVACIEPWIGLTAETLARVLGPTPLGAMLPAEDVGFAVVALYLGLEMLTHLHDDRQRSEALFKAATRLTTLVGSLSAEVAR